MWLQKRLLQVGQRPLNNAIDITNYVMWEIGHPIHAFDHDRLSQKTIIVREAKKGELVTTLDNKTHTMVGGEVVFDDGTGTIIDLPGIMGTQNTVVTKETRNVLLWIESVDAVKIRQTSMTHAIRSQAAVLNEKNVDPELAIPALLRGIDLYQEIADAEIGSQIIDVYPKKPEIKPILLKQAQLNTYLGIDIKPQKVTRILKDLGCAVEYKDDLYTVTPPSFRINDLKIYQDVIEEIARIYGYHNLPSKVMDTQIPDNPTDDNFATEHQIKTYLSGWGSQEIYTYSMISEDLATQSTYKLSEHLKIKNPLVDEMTYMRRSLVPSLIQVIEDNQKDNLTVFELQNTYQPKNSSKLPDEQMHLCIATNGTYKYLKGLTDALHQKLFIKDIVYNPKQISSEPLEINASGEIVTQNHPIGVIGKVKSKNIYIARYILKDLLKVAHTHPTYIPINNTPPIIEDLTFTLEDKSLVGHIIRDIKKVDPIISKVTQKDVYQQNHTFTIEYRHPEKPLSDQDIAPIRKKVVNTLKTKHQATLVGEI
jgi:phenylalanyl-tRNA synthetase beta chain